MGGKALRTWAVGLACATALVLAASAMGSATTRFEHRALGPLFSVVANDVGSTVVSEHGIVKCYSGVPVQLQRRVARGIWRSVRTFRTSTDGRFRFGLGTRSGTYRFTAPRIKVTVDGEQIVCKRAARLIGRTPS